MFLLDTNAVSVSRRPVAQRFPVVVEWMRARPVDELYVSAVSIWELEEGVLRMERRDPAQGKPMRAWLNDTMSLYDGRIVPFDHETALRCAALHVPNPQPVKDAMIAATALVHDLTVVTRNVRDFEAMGVPLLNPWEWAQ